MIYNPKDLESLKNGTMSPVDFDAKYGQGESKEALKPDQSQDDNIKVEVDDGQGIVEEVMDIPAQVVGGVAEGIDNAGEVLDHLGATLREKTGGKIDLPKYEGSAVDRGLNFVRDELIGDPKNPVSGFTRGVSQFVAGWYTGGKFLRGANWILKGGKTAKKIKDIKTTSQFVKASGKTLAEASTKGAIADAIFFDGQDMRLSDMVNEYAPWLENPLTRYLEADSEDTFWEGRLKNALEGVLVGGLVDSFLTVLRYRRFAKNRDLAKLKSPEQIQKDLDYVEENFADVKRALDEVDSKADTTLKQEDILSPETVEGVTASRVSQKVSETISETKIKETKTKKPLDEKEIDKISEEMADPTMGHDKKSFDYLVDQIDRFKRGEIDAIDLDASLNPRIFTKGVDTDILVFDRVHDLLSKAGRFDEGIENQALVERMARLTVDKSPGQAIQEINNLSRAVKNSTQVIAQSVILAQTMANAVPRIARIIRAQLDPVNIKLLEAQDKRVAQRLGITVEQAKQRRAQWTKQDLRKLIVALSQIVLDANWVKKQFARGTAFGNRKVGYADLNLDSFKRTLDSMSNFKGNEDAFITKLAMLDLPPEGILKILSKVFKGKGWDIANEWWINFLLSSPKTHIVNMTSNGVMMGLRPAEKVFYGIISGNRELLYEGIDIYAGLFHARRDANKFAWRAFRNEESVLDVGFTKTEGVARATGEGKFGKVLRGPTRFLSAEDEWFKQINYRGFLYARVNKLARLKKLSKKKTLLDDFGKPTSEYERFIKEEFDKGFDENFAWTNVDAIDYARELTFTKPLDPRSISGGLNSIIRENPGLRQIIPFLRTPMQIMHSGLDRIPIFGVLRKQYRQKLLGNPKYTLREIQDARSKAVMGTVILGLGGFLATQNKITGGGPENYKLKKALYRTGWRPYSIKIGDKYVSYARIEPISIVLGTLADFIEISSEIPPEDKANFEEQLFLSFLSTLATNTFSTSFRSLSKNLLSKTYLKGLSDLLEASVGEDEYKQQQVFYSFITSRVIPSVVKNMNTDPYYREVRGGLDAIRSKLPFFSESMEPRFNFLGEADVRPGSIWYRLLNPIEVSRENDDLIWQTFADLEFAPADTPEMMKGVDLKFYKKGDQTAYARFNEIIAKDMRKEITKLIKSSRFQKATPDGYFEGATYIGGRRDQITDKIDFIRTNAILKLRKERGFVSDKNKISLHQAIENRRMNKIRWENSKSQKDIEQILRVTQ